MPVVFSRNAARRVTLEFHAPLPAGAEICGDTSWLPNGFDRATTN